MTPAEFRAQLVELFGEDDLRDLCFELEIDFENLPGSTKSAKARELFIFCTRRGQLEALRATCARLRPHLAWPPLAVGPTPSPAVTSPTTTATLTPAVDGVALMRGIQQALGAHQQGEVASQLPDALQWHFPLLLRALVEGRLVPFLGAEANLCRAAPSGRAGSRAASRRAWRTWPSSSPKATPPRGTRGS